MEPRVSRATNAVTRLNQSLARAVASNTLADRSPHRLARCAPPSSSPSGMLNQRKLRALTSLVQVTHAGAVTSSGRRAG